MYRAPTPHLAWSVDIVHGQGSQHAVVCIQSVIDEIIVPATQNDRGGLRKCGGILDGNRHSVASKLVRGEKTDSSYVRTCTERARRRPGDGVDVQKPGLAPYDVEPGRDGYRNDVDVGYRGRERHGNSTPRHVSVAYAARAWRAVRAGRASRARRPLWSGGTCSSSCPRSSGRPWQARWPHRSLRSKLQPEEIGRRGLRIGVRYECKPERTCIRYSVIGVVSQCALPRTTVVDPLSQDLPTRVCG